MSRLRAEWRKLLTLPSLRLTALLTVAATLLLAYAYAAAGEPTGFGPLGYTLALQALAARL